MINIISLTEAIYEEIRAMEREGNQMGASDLAMKTLAKATKQRADEIVASLGSVERAWDSIKKLWNEIKDKTFNIGKKWS